MDFIDKMSIMKNPITRRYALALTAAGFAASCADNTEISRTSSSVQAPTSASAWSQSVPLPFPVQEIYPCAHDGAIHLAGGFIAENGRIVGPTAAYNTWAPGDKNWTADLPLSAPLHHPQLVSWQGGVFALAGFKSPSRDASWTMQSSALLLVAVVQEDFSIKREWSEGRSLPAPCAEAVVGVLGDGALHLAGGRTPKGEANANWNDHIDTDHHFVLTDLNGEWETAAPCLSKRNSAAGDVINGNLHIVGGRTVGGGNVATHEVYDHAEDRWRTAAPMPQAQGGLAAAAIGSKLYVFGGEFFDNGGGVYKEAWVYDAATDGWAALPDMPNPRHGLGAVALDGKIYVIGGALQASGVDTSAIVDVFTP